MSGAPHGFRLLADDLTGALDAAAEVVGRFGPVHVVWGDRAQTALPTNAAIDSGTRERGDAEACALVRALTPTLTGARLAFKKLDSLLRGHSLAELVACFAAGPWDRCILAPAFPYQGRITRAGQQYARTADGGWTEVGPALVPALRAAGLDAVAGIPGMELPTGITVFDAENDHDLNAIAATPADEGVLWAGTGGLAGALGGTLGDAGPSAVLTALPGPVLGLFGSDQAVTAGQLAACGAHWITLPDGSAASAGLIESRLVERRVALVSLDLPEGLDRQDAAGRIARALHDLARRLPPPGTLLVAGGETLRGLCDALGATNLEVQGRIVPGLPRSVLRGGLWEGVTIVSKSGGFGHPNLLLDLLRANDLERTEP